MSGAKRNREFDMELFFTALSDRTRLRLLNLMGEDEVCVCFFVEVLGESQPKISRHLAYLRRAGIVSARREGKWIHYRVTPPESPAAARILETVRAWLAEEKDAAGSGASGPGLLHAVAAGAVAGRAEAGVGARVRPF